MDNQKTTQKTKISDLISSSLESIRELVDTNTIVGDPISASAGTTIIPISKVSVGYAGGGNDYAGKNSAAVGKNNFGGGGGTGVSVTPVGFLVVRADGSVELLNINNPTGGDIGSSLESIVDKAPDIISKIKNMLAERKKKKEETKAAEEAEKAEAEKSEGEKAEGENGEADAAQESENTASEEQTE